MAVYIELLMRWNQKINLTTITDLDEIVARNFAESFLGAHWLTPEPSHYCDVGSGAGFPGLALKLIRPADHATLLEPVGKKAAFLSEVARTVGAKHLDVECTRWQDSRLQPSSLDAVLARALGGYAKLAEWAKGRLKPGGRLILWLGAQDAGELRALSDWNWQFEPIPGSRERLLLVGNRR
jgi:16S rRNA (guanine527-N7)-methyltransferase